MCKQVQRILKKIDYFEDKTDWLGFPIKPILLDWFNDKTMMLDSFESRIERLIAFEQWCSLRKITKPRKEDIVCYFNDLRASGFRDSSVKAYSVSLKSCFGRFYAVGVYTDVFNLLVVKSGDYRVRTCLSSEEVKKLIRFECEPEDRAMLCLMVFCGLRCIEVSELTWGDIDGKTARIRGKGNKEKNNKIFIPDFVVEALNKWKRVSISRNEPCDSVFKIETRRFSRDFERMSASVVSRRVSNVLKKCFPDKPEISAHCLRHTAITLAAESGMDVFRVAKFARHSTPAMTLHYMHDLKRFSDPAEARIENMVLNDEPKEASTPEHIEDAVKAALLKLLSK